MYELSHKAAKGSQGTEPLQGKLRRPITSSTLVLATNAVMAAIQTAVAPKVVGRLGVTGADLRTVRTAYAAAIRNLDSAERTAELLQLADLANVRLQPDLDRAISLSE